MREERDQEALGRPGEGRVRGAGGAGRGACRPGSTEQKGAQLGSRAGEGGDRQGPPLSLRTHFVK